MQKNIMILGGYGGVGAPLSELLAKDGRHQITVAGRNIEKGTSFCDRVNTNYQRVPVRFRQVDGRSPRSLMQGLEGIDLLIVSATIPESMEEIARAALYHGVDMMDILVRADVISQLRKFEHQVVEDGRQFFTQCGFHPGIILPVMKYIANRLDVVIEADVFMAMEPVFKTVESTREIFYEAIKSTPSVLKNGQWKKVGYNDSKTKVFSPPFGKKKCYPLHMPEIKYIDKVLGVQNAGVYVGGFNWYIDYVIFTIAIILGKINPNLSQNVCSWLLYQSTKGSNNLPKVEMISEAQGVKEGCETTVSVTLKSNDGYLLTAQAIYALLDQYFDGSIAQPGVHLMGEAIDEQRMIRFLSQLGVLIKEE